MKIIFVTQKHSQTLSLTMSSWMKAFVSFCFLGVPAGAMVYAHLAHEQAQQVANASPNAVQQTIALQQQEIETAKKTAEQQLSALMVKVGELQSRMLRIDAVGERLTSMAGLEKGEFDFSAPPPLGGPETSVLSAANTYDMESTLDQITLQLKDREHQLETLEALLSNKRILNEVSVAGRPITKGWMSSYFGMRNDPFSGKRAWHAGVDFAGEDGSDVISVASGIVTWASDKYGYGNLVEVHHSDGVKTRYAHLKDMHVKVGDVVKRGQVLASMGSTGRSTGPHVHFEVYKHGRAVDPATYINKTHP